MFQRSYVTAIVLDHVIAYGNKGNILISAAAQKVSTYNLTINNTLSAHGTSALKVNYSVQSEHFHCHTTFIQSPTNIVIVNSKFINNKISDDLPIYNLTINNSISSGAYGYALATDSFLTHYKQCSTGQIALSDSIIAIINSHFNYNNNTNAVVSINAIDVIFTKRIIMQSTEMCHNIGYVLDLKHYSYRYQTQFFVTLENFIANNSNCPYLANGPRTVINALFVTNLVLNNVSITNNNMTGLAAFNTAVVVNGTSLFYNNTGINGGGLTMYANSFLVFYEHSILNFTYNSAKQRGGTIFVDAACQSTILVFSNTLITRFLNQ